MTAPNQADNMRGDYERWRVSQGFNFVQADFDVWQASAKVSRKAALTEAAELCERLIPALNVAAPAHPFANERAYGWREGASNCKAAVEGLRDAS